MTGAIVAYARSIPLLSEDLQTIRPTILISVPRIYERVYAAINAKLDEGFAAQAQAVPAGGRGRLGALSARSEARRLEAVFPAVAGAERAGGEEDTGASRRPPAHRRQRRCGAAAGDLAPLRRSRRARAAGLWPDRDQPDRVRQPLWRTTSPTASASRYATCR